MRCRLLSLSLVMFAVGCGDERKPAPAPTPAAKPAEASLPAWKDVISEPFSVQMPGDAKLETGLGLAFHDGETSYILNVEELPAYRAFLSDNDIVERYSKGARSKGQVVRSRHVDVHGHRAFEQDIIAQGVHVYLAYLRYGRWHAQLTAIYPPGKDDAKAAERFIASLQVKPVKPATGFWECDALLASSCKACGDSSPACKQLVEGANVDRCALESVMVIPPNLQKQQCGTIQKAGKLVLTGLGDVKFDPSQVEVSP